MIRRSIAAVLDLLRSNPDVHALTPGGSWTVRDTAVHIIVGARLYTRMINGQPPPIDWLPKEANAWNAAAFTALDEDDPTILADLLEQATGSLIAASREHGPDAFCPCYAVFGGQQSVGFLNAIQINEYLLHWADMASAVRVATGPVPSQPLRSPLRPRCRYWCRCSSAQTPRPPWRHPLHSTLPGWGSVTASAQAVLRLWIGRPVATAQSRVRRLNGYSGSRGEPNGRTGRQLCLGREQTLLASLQAPSRCATCKCGWRGMPG